MSRTLSDGPFRTMLEEITARHGDTLVSTMRKQYGFNFLPLLRSSDNLRDVLLRVDEPSRAQMAKDYAPGSPFR